MKVLFVLSGSSIYAGSTKAFMGLLDFVLKDGIQVGVLCPQNNGVYPELIKRGVEVVVSDLRFSIWPIRTGLKHKILFIPRLLYRSTMNLVAYYRLLRFAKQFRPDIIHTNVSVVDIGFRVARELGIQHVWHIREYGKLDFDFAPSYKSFLRKLNAEGNKCIAITEGVKAYHSLSDTKCEVIYDGVMSEKDCRYKKQKRPYFLFAGRLDESKGIEDCIRSFTIYYNETNSRVELWVAGSTTDNNYFEHLKRLAGTAPVKFLGMRNDIYDLMYDATALIVPSRHEGFGFITAEAMFNGCLVIGRNTSGTKEQMDNGRTITGEEIALRFESEKELVSRLKEVDGRDLSEYEDMIMNGQRVVRQLYSRESHAAKVLSLYRRLLSQSVY